MVFVHHSDETRERAVIMTKLGWDEKIVKAALKVSLQSIDRWVDKYDDTGLFTLDYSNCGSKLKLESVLRELEALTREDPTLYIDEYIDWVAVTRGILVASGTMSMTLDRLGLRIKQLRKHASQRDHLHRAQWVRDVFRRYVADQLICVDECGVNNGDLERTRGRGLPNERVVVDTPFQPRGDTFTAFAAISLDGYEAVRMSKGSSDGDVFYDFIEHEVLPSMNPYPMPKSVLVLDNATIHHSQELQDLVEGQGCVLLFLPAYSPDFNPIEESFSAVKSYLKRHGSRFLRGVDLEHEILRAFASAVTPEKARGWFHDSGFNIW